MTERTNERVTHVDISQATEEPSIPSTSGCSILETTPLAEEEAADGGFCTPPSTAAGHETQPSTPPSYQALHSGKLGCDSDDESDSSSSTSDTLDPKKQKNADDSAYDELQSLQATGTMANRRMSHPFEGEEGTSSPTQLGTSAVQLFLSYRVQNTNRSPRYTLIVYDFPQFRNERSSVRRRLVFDAEAPPPRTARNEQADVASPAERLPVPPGTPIKRRRNVTMPTGATEPVPIRVQRAPPVMAQSERKRQRPPSTASDPVSRAGASGITITTLIRLGNGGPPSEQTKQTPVDRAATGSAAAGNKPPPARKHLRF